MINPRLRRPLVNPQGLASGVNEHAAVADLVVIEQLTESRVKPGFGQFIIKTQVDQRDISAVHQRPLSHFQQHIRVIRPYAD